MSGHRKDLSLNNYFQWIENSMICEMCEKFAPDYNDDDGNYLCEEHYKTFLINSIAKLKKKEKIIKQAISEKENVLQSLTEYEGNLAHDIEELEKEF